MSHLIKICQLSKLKRENARNNPRNDCTVSKEKEFAYSFPKDTEKVLKILMTFYQNEVIGIERNDASPNKAHDVF